MHGEHIFAYVPRNQKYPHKKRFEISATVYPNMDESLSACRFILVRRIHAACAYSVLDVDIHELKENISVYSYPSSHEVFIVISIKIDTTVMITTTCSAEVEAVLPVLWVLIHSWENVTW